MATQPCNTANGYWRLHQYLCGYSALSHCKWVLGITSIYGYSALSHCKWELGIASTSSWLLSPVTLQMGTGDCINIFMAAQPCNKLCKWLLGIASISSWLLSPVTLQMGTGDCINIFMAAQPCNNANGNCGLHQYLHGCSTM